ncbi:NAD(+)/NADH kinase [Natronobacterium texcoconense]|uniref:NAD kinase n=1 Tax=Natronobacterium texcoconense TaxID=1095778 RepID=A0A1H1C9Z1_NATTX|nr:inositol monophosphatase family protein [Natronobacterium texcoconense]SDQ60984.1 myo-inositol-1(or 4)-monophosphatase [Natronobacterium texcoconense]
MRGRRLATTEEIVAIVSPAEESEAAVRRLESWASDNGLGLETVDVGDDIDDVYDPDSETLGVTIGGDGTFLEGIQQFEPRNVPILGINTGTLAFLVRVDVDDLEAALTEVVQGRATIDERQQITVEANGLEATGINDVMVKHVQPEEPVDRKITKLDVFADGQYVGEYDGTGLAIATPTGSTGISLSANGPVHNPTNNSCLQIVPLHTHRMGVRPLIVSEDTEICIVCSERADMLIDGGRFHEQLEADDVITVTGAASTANVVRTSHDDDFFTAITELLGWGARDAEGESLPPTVSSEAGPDCFEERACELAKEAVRSVRNPLRNLHGKVETERYKTDTSDVITEADYLSENIITTAIENEYPAHTILTEEGIHTETGSEYTWLVDPLDGTGNYANGNPNYAVSLALLENDEPIVGVVYAPETDELWSAIAGEGAYKNGSPITTTDRDALEESMLMSGYDPEGIFLSYFYDDTRGVRRLGSAALHLCYLANGSADAVWEYDTYPWDVAAGIVIAREAGASVTDSSGESFEVYGEKDRQELVASNGHIHDDLTSRLRDNEYLYNTVDN